jgi:tRNA-splicing endonuclease subunit Sen2
MAEAAAEAEAAFAEGRAPSIVAIPSGATWKPQANSDSNASVPEIPEIPDEEIEQREECEEEPLEDVEHLQLTLQEAFFLSWNLDCLTILNPTTVPFFIYSVTLYSMISPE